MKRREQPAAQAATTAEAAYDKDQILAAKRFSPQQKDLLAALLSDEASYTLNEAEQQIEQFQQGTVE